MDLHRDSIYSKTELPLYGTMRDPQEHNDEQEKSEKIGSVCSSYTGSPRQAEPVWRGEAGVQAAGWVVGKPENGISASGCWNIPHLDLDVGYKGVDI